ncbi:MAG: DUF2508 family protein [Clostridia bacterium]|nr:DUF2508 family protein [Clostridia bacterium]
MKKELFKDFFTDFDFMDDDKLVTKKDLDDETRLLSDIRDLELQLRAANLRFQSAEDSDLVEASIYEIKSLDAKYRYLIKLAKSKKMKSADVGALYIRSA